MARYRVSFLLETDDDDHEMAVNEAVTQILDSEVESYEPDGGTRCGVGIVGYEDVSVVEEPE